MHSMTMLMMMRFRFISTSPVSLAKTAQKTKEVTEQVTAVSNKRPIVPPDHWSYTSKRTGLLFKKIGMTADWDNNNIRIPLTVLKLDRCQITQVKKKETDGYDSLQMGIGFKPLNRTSKAVLVHSLKAGVLPKLHVQEFMVTPDAFIPAGTTLDVRHFALGQYVDCTAVTVGKGFQGGMKKWGFKGLRASHGVSIAHRSIGSTGMRQDPGRVFKNKKMSGGMGGKRRTIQNLWVYAIDPKESLIYIKGAIPGKNGWVRVKDSVKKRFDAEIVPPFPTFFPPKDENTSELSITRAISFPLLEIPLILKFATKKKKGEQS